MEDPKEFMDLIQHAKQHVGFKKQRSIEDVKRERLDNRMGTLSHLLTRYGASSDDLDELIKAKNENKKILADILANLSIRVGIKAENFEILAPDYFSKLKSNGVKDEDIIKIATVEKFLESDKKELSEADILQMSVNLNNIGIEVEPAKLSNFVKKNFTDPDIVSQITQEVKEILEAPETLDILKKELKTLANICLTKLQVKWRKISSLPIEQLYINTKKDLLRYINQILKDDENISKKSSFLVKKHYESIKNKIKEIENFYELELDLVYVKYLSAFLYSNTSLGEFNNNLPENFIKGLFSLGITNENKNPKILKILEKGLDLEELKELKLYLENITKIQNTPKTQIQIENKFYNKKITETQNQLKLIAPNTQKEFISKAKKGDFSNLSILYWLKRISCENN